MSLDNRFKFKKAQIRDDGGGFGGDDADDMGDEFEGNAGVADMAKDNIDEDGSENIDDEMEVGNPGQARKANDHDLLQ